MTQGLAVAQKPSDPCQTGLVTSDPRTVQRAKPEESGRAQKPQRAPLRDSGTPAPTLPPSTHHQRSREPRPVHGPSDTSTAISPGYQSRFRRSPPRSVGAAILKADL